LCVWPAKHFVGLLAQALPVTALAAIGRALSAEDLAAAYALTGYGDGIQSNGYHRGIARTDAASASLPQSPPTRRVRAVSIPFPAYAVPPRKLAKMRYITVT
jgi:hypothetical protein